MTAGRKENAESDSDSDIEVIEYEADDQGEFAVDDEGDPKEGFYWRIGGATEVGPYPDFDSAAKAARQAWTDSSY